MDIERSRNGYYTITFLNKNNLDEREIHREFSSVGHVCKIIQNSNRIFIRYKQKDEAERAIQKFGKTYEVFMAKNRTRLVLNYSAVEQALVLVMGDASFDSDIHQPEGGFSNNQKTSNYNPALLPSPDTPSSGHSMEKLIATDKVFHLILGNLPKNYTIKDVKGLVEEAKPVYINQLEETRVFSIRFCHVLLSSVENLNYLIDKLNGFMICGEKLIAAEVKHLLEWREKTG